MESLDNTKLEIAEATNLWIINNKGIQIAEPLKKE